MSEQLRRATELLGMPVYAAAQGERIGEVSALLIQRDERAVGVVGMTGSGFRHTRYFPFSAIRTAGADAVMLESAAALQSELPPEQIRTLESRLSERPVITRSGEKLGAISDFLVDTASGRLVSYMLRCDSAGLARLVAFLKYDTVELPDSMIVALGSDAVIVRDEAFARPE